MRSPLSYLTFWFVPLLVRFNVYLGATKGLFDASVVLLLVTACTSSAIAMILGHLTDLGFCQGQRWAVFAGPVMLLGVSLFSAVSSVSSMVVMARMSQNVLVTLRNSFFSRAPQYQMFSIGRMSVKFVNKDTIALSGATESFMVLVRDSMLAVALLAVTFWHNWQLMLMTVFFSSGVALRVALDQPPEAFDRQSKSRQRGCDALTGGRVIRRTKARTGRLQLRQ